jgi:acyl-CoA thioester hydrolase
VTDEPGVLRVEVLHVPFSDMDVLGHASHIAYFRYMQEARVSWVLALAEQIPANQAPVVVSASCNYSRPVNYPATLEVVMTAGATGRSSFVLHYEIRDKTSQQVVATGETRMVWFDRRTERSTLLPQAVRVLLESSS